MLSQNAPSDNSFFILKINCFIFFIREGVRERKKMTTMARNGLRARNPCLLSRWYKHNYLSCHHCWPSKQAVGISNLSFEVDLEPLVWDMILSCVMYLQGQMPVPIHLSDYVHLVLQLLSILLIFVSKL